MARHTKTRTFTAEFYRLIASAPAGAGRGETNVLASATFDYANSAADGPLNTTFRRDPTSADKNNVVVMDTLVLRGDSDDMADPATLATITIDSAPSGTRRGFPELVMPKAAPSPTTVVRQVTYTQPQATRFIRRTGAVVYSGGTVSLDALSERAVHVEPAVPARLDGYQQIDTGDSRWSDGLYTPGTDLHFDMAWAGYAGIASACQLTFEV